MTIEITDKKNETNIIQKFCQNHERAIFNTGTIFLNLYFFVNITKIIMKNALNNRIPQPNESHECVVMNLACFYGLKNGKVFPKNIYRKPDPRTKVNSREIGIKI